MDYNATTPMESEVIQTITETMREAWGNPSSSYAPGRKAKESIDWSREVIAQMIGGHPEDIIFTSGGTESNNLVFHTAVNSFWSHHRQLAQNSGIVELGGIALSLPHIITSNIEHDSVQLVVENLVKEGKAKATFLSISKKTGCVEVDDVITAIGPSTCLVSVMLANNETGVIMPIAEICQQLKVVNHQRGKEMPKVLLHTDAAQALGKLRVDVQDLGVDYLTIVGHKPSSDLPSIANVCVRSCLEKAANIDNKKTLITMASALCYLQFYGPRIGALYVRSPGTSSPMYAMFFGGGQERMFRPGTENTPMIAGLGKAAELVNKKLDLYASHMKEVRDYLEASLVMAFGKEKLCFNSHFQGSDRLPNTCNVSILGPNLQGRKVLQHCRRLLASVGAACHSENVSRPSHVLLKSGIPYKVAENAIRLSVGRATSKEDVDLIIEDLKQAINEIELCAAEPGLLLPDEN